MTDTWNPWHGCQKYSEGCAHCYVYRRDARYGKDSSVTVRTADFDLPLRKGRDGRYKIPAGARVFACMTSDFFVEAADPWRDEAWDMIRRRPDVQFTIITKRALRMPGNMPADWGDGWPNLTFACTCENQRRADERLDTFLSIPMARRMIACEPMLEAIDLSKWLDSRIDLVVAGGESGPEARVMDYGWALSLRDQCARAGVHFYFKQTGALFRKDGRLYRIERILQAPQAKKAGINL